MANQLAQIWPSQLMFFSSGFAYASWGVGIAVIDSKFKLSHNQLTIILFIVSAGAIVTMMPAGKLIKLFGSKSICHIGGLLQAALISQIMRIDDFHSLLFVLFGFGMANALFDTAMNTQAFNLELALNTSLLSGMHGWFSLGGIIGAGLTSLWVGFNYWIGYIFYLSSLLTLFITYINYHRLIIDLPSSTIKLNISTPQSNDLYFISLLGFIALLAEGAIYDWSTIFMRDIVNADQFWIGLGYVCFSIGMMLSRFFGDRIRTLKGDILILQGSACMAAIGLTIITFEPSLLFSGIGFFLTGLGVANLIPILFKMAALKTNKNAGEGIAYVSRIAYLGFFIGPVAMGYLAAEFELSFALKTIALSIFIITLTAHRAAFK